MNDMRAYRKLAIDQIMPPNWQNRTMSMGE